MSTEYSAGGVVVRDHQCVVIVPTRRAADGSQVLALPQGHVDPGETPTEGAARAGRGAPGGRRRPGPGPGGPAGSPASRRASSGRWATSATSTCAAGGGSPSGS